MIFKRVTSLVLGFAICALSAWAEPKSELQVQFSNEPTQYDPLLMEDGLSMRLAGNVLGTLYAYDGGGQLQKRLVETWQVSKDAKTVTVRFKKNLKWSDGVPFVADHWIQALRRVSLSGVKSATSQFIPQFDLELTKALDDSVAQVVLKSPDPLFPEWTTLSALAPIRPEMIESYAKKPQPVMPSLGDYYVSEYKREDFLLLKRNPYGVHVEATPIESVRIRFIKEETVLVSLMKSGAIDILFRVPVLQQDSLKKIARVWDVPAEAVTYLGLNTKKPPFQDLNYRRALRDALKDRKVELAALLKTDEIPAQQLLPKVVLPAIVPPKWVSPKSRELAPISFSAQSDVSARNQNILEFIQAELKKTLKWKLSIDMQEWKSHYAKIKVDPAPVYRFGWQNPVSHPYLTFQILLSNSPNNFTGWKSDAYDQKVEKLRTETSPKRRAQLVSELETILWEESPVIPVLHQVLKFSTSKRVHGFRANSFGVILFREIRLQ
jgi:oligopeptide transport system substrate-binding protein